MTTPKDIELAQPIDVTSRGATELEIDAAALRRYAPPLPAGSFDFSDGTDGGWSLDQLYDVDGAKPVLITGFPVPPPGSAAFNLTNNQKLALSADTNILLAPKSVKMLGFSFVSPDLKGRVGWTNITGYRLDFYRRFFSWLNAPNLYLVQLQAEFTVKASGAPKSVAEADPQTGQALFHPTAFEQPYAFAWTAKEFQDQTLELRRLRVFCKFVNAAGVMSGEAAPSGDWLIGNVGPLPAK